MNFASDNAAGAHPTIMAALQEEAAKSGMPYGGDETTQGLETDLSRCFGREVWSFPVTTGSAANALALAVVTPPYGAVYCHQDSHINVDECGAPEFFTHGAKLICLPGDAGKLTPETLSLALARQRRGTVHAVQPAVVSLTQASEWGTVYTPEEVRALATLAHAHGLRVHMDGARFANAVAALGVSPAALTWEAGVDMLSFGATKNGALAAEAVIFFDSALVRDFAFRRKRSGQLLSKLRFISAQLRAYLQDDLWLTLAAHANLMAARLATGLARLPGVTLACPVEINEVFVHLPSPLVTRLRQAGFVFYDWPGDPLPFVRLVTAFNTPEASVDHFIEVAAR